MPGPGVLVPASMTGELEARWKSSVVLVAPGPQSASSLKAWEAEARGGGEGHAVVVVLQDLVGGVARGLQHGDGGGGAGGDADVGEQGGADEARVLGGVVARAEDLG